MHTTLPFRDSGNVLDKTERESALLQSNPARDEIEACLATRDLLLREAEKHTDETNLRRAISANEFAVDCLRPVRSPYETQALPESHARGERRRCQAVRRRLAELETFLRRRAA
ncbi:MAG TPA: hypothetical protein VGI60_12295 [Chthoniobacterales bacterium]|jgi:hypothetical protein